MYLRKTPRKRRSFYLGNLFLYSFILLTVPLFGESAMNVLQSGISWVDEKVFNRTIVNFEVNKNNQDIILLKDDSKTNIQRNIEQKKIAKTTDVAALKKIIENSETDNPVKNLQTLDKDQEATNLVAENTNNLSLTAGESDKNVTYMQILQKPNDLELNLKYARQQGKMGNYKQTIATLERLVILHPDNADLKFYLLSILVKADTPDKALGLIEEIKLIPDLSSEDLASVNEIEIDLKDSKGDAIFVIKDHHFYEGIQKYDMYFAGWNDNDSVFVVVKEHGDKNVTSQKQIAYRNLWGRYNTIKTLAVNGGKFMLINRVVSMMDALLLAKKWNNKYDVKLSLNAFPDLRNKSGVGGVKLSLRWK